MGVKELGLLLSAGSLAIPPARTIAIDEVAGGTSDGDMFATHGDQGACPFFVLEGRGALEDDLGTAGETGQVEGGSSWNFDVVKGDSRAFRLARFSSGSGGERAAVSSFDRRGRSEGGAGDQAVGEKRSKRVHD